MPVLVNLLLGLLFGAGLVISGMSNPAKVLNFLDVTGTWDPSLAFVMGGAVITAFVGYRIAFRRSRPVFATAFQLPTKRDVDNKLVLGAAIFGVGWGLVGLCPGPAFTALYSGKSAVVVFLVAMILGIWGARALQAAQTAPQES